MRDYGIHELMGTAAWLANGRWEIWRSGRHRLVAHIVWEHFHGPLSKGTVVHHIDGNTTNDEMANLQCMTVGEHVRLHKTGNNYFKGHKHTPESRALMTAGKLGNTYRLGTYPTPETRERLSAAQKGRTASAETRSKMSAAHKGKRRVVCVS
ncbi:MAG: HNH endonuclease [Candidatus Atribacteria bacterium]|nr:HNH endonuclease [Candidatus Atribacteria bacterium]